MVFYLPGFPQTTKTVARPEQTPVGKVAFFYLRTTFLHLYTTYLISICLYIYNICVYNAHLMCYLQTLSLYIYIYIYTYSTYHPPIWDSLEHSKYLRTTYIFTYLVYPLYITYIYTYIQHTWHIGYTTHGLWGSHGRFLKPRWRALRWRASPVQTPVLSIIRNTLVNLELWRETIKLII